MNQADRQADWEYQNPLMRDPLYKPEDLGKPIPGGPHSVSGCLPKWQDTIDFKLGDPRVTDKLQVLYPRTKDTSLVRQMTEKFRQELDIPLGDALAIFTDETTAGMATRYVEKGLGKQDVRVIPLPHNLCALHVINPHWLTAEVLQQFMHDTGFIVSSRLAEDALTGTYIEDAQAAKVMIRARVARALDGDPNHVFLYANGMQGIYHAHAVARSRNMNKKSVQYGFPYTATLNIQRDFGPGVHMLARGDADELGQIKELVAQKAVSAVYIETPSNPMLSSVDIEALSQILRAGNTPLIVDDTLTTPLNVDVRPFADMITSSLTKSFSGRGDVMGGSVYLNPQSPLYRELKEAFDVTYTDRLYSHDAQVLAANSADWSERTERMDENAEALTDFLRTRLPKDRVFYPKHTRRTEFDQIRKPGGRFGHLVSFLPEDEKTAAAIFDHLKLTKGPSLGTNYTLVCAYTRLAHQQELAFVEQMGIFRQLIRTSVGLEAPEKIVRAYEEAFDQAGI